MEPTLSEGDVVWASGWLKVKEGDLVVARVGSMDIIKRLAVLPDGQAVLSGDNKQPHHNVLLTEKVKLLGRVFWPPSG